MSSEYVPKMAHISMNTVLEDSFMLMWHIGPLLGNDCETNNETTEVVRQRPARNYGSTVGSGVFYVSAPRLYHATD
jgi:hypothetical protein